MKDNALRHRLTADSRTSFRTLGIGGTLSEITP